MITRFGKIRIGENFVSFNENTRGEIIWTKATSDGMALDKDGTPCKFADNDSIYKLSRKKNVLESEIKYREKVS